MPSEQNMSEFRNLFPTHWIDWIQQNPIWLLAGAAIILLWWIFSTVGNRIRLRQRLPFSSSYQDFQTQGKYWQNRSIKPIDSDQPLPLGQYLKSVLKTSKSDQVHSFVFLCPPGSGKTWLLYQVARFLGKKSQRWVHRSCLEDNLFEQLDQVSLKERTWLLLDDLESLSPELQKRERIEKILNASSGFKAVVLAISPERWPKGWRVADQQGRIKLVGEDQFQWGKAGWLVDWTAYEAQKNLRNVVGSVHKDSVNRVIDGIDWRNPVWARPAIIKAISLGVGLKGANRYVYQAINSSLQKVIGESRDEQWWDTLAQIAAGDETSASDPLPPALTKVLHRNRAGRLIFRQRLYEGFFLARNTNQHHDKASLREVRSHPEARYLYLEQVWQSFLESSHPEAGVFLTNQGNKVSLRTLTTDLLRDVKFLELPELHQQDFRFLRLLPSLERIWILKGSTSQFAQLYKHWKPKHGARVYVKTPSGNWEGESRFIQYGEGKRWDPIPNVEAYHPGLPAEIILPPKNFSPLSRLFRLDPNILPNPLCKEVDIPGSREDGISSVYELSLEAGEFELFDKVYLFLFENGNIHLQYLHTRPQNHLENKLPEMMEKWVLFAGPDDNGLRELTIGEKVDLLQGSWTGRQWLNQIPQLGAQVLIRQTRIDHLEIWIRNGARLDDPFQEAIDISTDLQGDHST